MLFARTFNLLHDIMKGHNGEQRRQRGSELLKLGTPHAVLHAEARA
jgi:hypothetical protein